MGKKIHYEPTKEFIEDLKNRCNNRECPIISRDIPTICKKNCPIVKKCIDKFGIDLITI